MDREQSPVIFYLLTLVMQLIDITATTTQFIICSSKTVIARAVLVLFAVSEQQ